ncbi:MAG: hypothetical protein IPJ85_12580 [Flavobacteriales bacterium]|nr:hypothetical protein [Flavobacteriales bacterium]
MRTLIALIICVNASGLCAQPFNWQWSVAPTGGQTLFGSATDAEGNTYLTGRFNFNANFPPLPQLTTLGAETDGFVAKYSPDGAALWVVSFTGTTNDECRGISVDALGGVYVTGFFTSPTLTIGGETLTRIGTQDAFVAKLAADGACLWAMDLSTSEDDFEQGTSITSAPNGDSYVTGYYKGTFDPAGSTTLTSCVNGSNLFILKLDADGDVLWSRSPVCPSQPSYGESYGQVVHVDVYGNLFLAGAFRGATCTFGDSTFVNYSESSNNLLWAKFNLAGDLLWARSFGANLDDRAFDIDTDLNGNAYLAIERRGNYTLPEFTIPYNTGGSFNWRTLALKCDLNGVFLWYERVGGSADDHSIWSIKVLPDGSFMLGGEFSRQCTFDSFTIPWNNYDEFWSLFLARYNAAGVAQQVFVRRQAYARAIRGITADEAGNVYMAGYFYDSLTVGNLPIMDVANSALVLARSGDFSTAAREDQRVNASIAYPNPSAGPVRITSPFAFDRIRFMDAAGRLIFEHNVGDRTSWAGDSPGQGAVQYSLWHRGSLVGVGRIMVE